MASLKRIRDALAASPPRPPLVKPDLDRCQAEKPGNGPFILGGEIGDPRNGYRVRCRSKPTVIARERQPGEDGRRGSMSLCNDCKRAFIDQLGSDHADFKDIRPKPKRKKPPDRTPQSGPVLDGRYDRPIKIY